MGLYCASYFLGQPIYISLLKWVQRSGEDRRSWLSDCTRPTILARPVRSVGINGTRTCVDLLCNECLIAWVWTCCPLYESSVDGLVNHSPVVPNPESHPLRRHSVSLRASLPLQFSYTNITLRCCNLNWKLCTFLALCKLNLVSYLLSRCWPRGTWPTWDISFACS